MKFEQIDKLQQSPTKIPWSTCTGCEMSCNVTPDKGLFGSEYALSYTTPDFETKYLVQMEKDHTGDEDYVNKKFDLFREPQGGAIGQGSFFK